MFNKLHIPAYRAWQSGNALETTAADDGPYRRCGGEKLLLQELNGIFGDATQIGDRGVQIGQFPGSRRFIHPALDQRCLDNRRRHVPGRTIMRIDQFPADPLQLRFLYFVHRYLLARRLFESDCHLSASLISIWKYNMRPGRHTMHQFFQACDSHSVQYIDITQ